MHGELNLCSLGGGNVCKGQYVIRWDCRTPLTTKKTTTTTESYENNDDKDDNIDESDIYEGDDNIIQVQSDNNGWRLKPMQDVGEVGEKLLKRVLI